MTKEQIMESRAGDYIRAKKLSKKDALKPENLKAIRAAMDPKNPTKTSVANAKKAIENVFNGKEKLESKGKSTDKSSKDTGKFGASSKETNEPSEEEKDGDKKEEKGKEESKGGLTPEQKEEVKDAVADTDLNLSGTDAARKQAEQNPIEGYSLSKKMYFVHNGAKKKAEEAIKKYLQSAKAGEVNVKVTNSAASDTEYTFNVEAKKYIVGVHVLLDKTTVAGLRKLMAVLKESEQIDEGIWDGLKSMFGRVSQAVKDGAKDVAAEAQKKIDATNEKMKELIGVLAIKAYITHFIGKRIGDKIDKNSVYAGINESGEMKGRISYYTAVTMK